MQIIRQRAYARAGLVGNPSDGYHGKTISISVRNFFAEVILYEWERFEILLSQEDISRFDSVDELVQDVELHGYYGGVRLVKATIKRFVEFCHQQRDSGLAGYELSDRKFSIRYESNIPRQVGLAGSSAIIMATLRALQEFYEVKIPLHVLPSLALSVERDELGIGAGLQDRVIQAYGGAVYMDFAKEQMSIEAGYECGSYEPIDVNLLPPLYLAYTHEMSEPTEVTHNPLRARYNAGVPQVVDAMDAFASYAADAREAILVGDAAKLGALMNQNFDKRNEICQLSEQHRRMIEVARSVGASAKFAGSGGAIVGTYQGAAGLEALVRELGKIRCSVLEPVLG
jgi:glucuronokinase